MWRVRFVCCLTLAACAFLTCAQQNAPAFHAVPQTSERFLNVVASDGKGDPVTDLTGADFEVFDDGKAQPITSFKATAGRESRARTQPTILIVFDLLNAIPSQRAYTSALIVRTLQPLEESD